MASKLAGDQQEVTTAMLQVCNNSESHVKAETLMFVVCQCNRMEVCGEALKRKL